MIDLTQKDFIVVVQCHIVKERCSGYLCEKAFTERKFGFADYPKDKAYRLLYLTCGGCCGRALQRKLTQFLGQLKEKESIGKDRIVVQLSTCISKDNHHGPICPHIDYLKDLIAKTGLDVRQDTHISKRSEALRQAGVYKIS